MRFDQAKVFITGGASGIGRATAGRLRDEGASICVADINVDALDRVSSEFGVEAVEVDVRSEKSVESALEAATQRLGGLNVVINSAGVVMRKLAEEVSESDWRNVIGVNLDGTFFCSKHAIRHLKASGGTIINVASWHGGNSTISGYSAYAGSKAGVIGLTKSMALEGGPYGIRVNAICPGIINTPMWHRSLSQFENPDDLQKVVNKKHPLGHVGEPEDVAAAIAFFASQDARFITGAVLFVDGGMSVQLPHVFDNIQAMQ